MSDNIKFKIDGNEYVANKEESIWDVAKNLMQFFKHESCGQCTPCRLGTEKAVTIMNSSKFQPELLSDIASVMREASICGLGQAASNPLMCAMQYFPEECERSYQLISKNMHFSKKTEDML